MSDDAKPGEVRPEAKQAVKGIGGDELKRIKEVAVQLFAQQRATAGSHYKTDALAVNCIRDAAIFQEQFNLFAAGKLEIEVEEPILDIAFMPNLDRDHPLNLCSEMYGDPKIVAEVADDLERQPLLEKYDRFKWKLPEVKIARAIFPAFRKKYLDRMEAKNAASASSAN